MDTANVTDGIATMGWSILIMVDVIAIVADGMGA